MNLPLTTVVSMLREEHVLRVVKPFLLEGAMVSHRESYHRELGASLYAANADGTTAR